MIYNGIQSFVTFMLTRSNAAQRLAHWPVKNELLIYVAFPSDHSTGAVVSPTAELNWDWRGLPGIFTWPLGTGDFILGILIT